MFSLCVGRSTPRSEVLGIDRRYVLDWDKYQLKEGVLYRSEVNNDEEIKLLCLPSSLKEEIFKVYHDDLGHQG